MQRDPVVVRSLQQVLELPGFDVANRDEQLRDLMPADDRAEARDCPEHRNAVDEEILLAGVIVDEANRQNADVAVLEQLTNE